MVGRGSGTLLKIEVSRAKINLGQVERSEVERSGRTAQRSQSAG